MQVANWALALSLATGVANADPALFEKIHKRQRIRVITPGGECLASVLARTPYELKVRITSSASVCGPANSVVSVSRYDVRDVIPPERMVDDRQTKAIAAMLTIGVTALAYPLAQVFDGKVLGGIVIGGPLVAGLGAGLVHAHVHAHGPRFDVFVMQVTAVFQP
jgi:hypothetical protein